MPGSAPPNRTHDKHVLRRQAPLREAYARAPDLALITYEARSSSSCVPATEPLSTAVFCGEHNAHYIAAGVHRAFGGECNLPAPEEIFAASIAAALDTAIRMTANEMGIELTWLNVQAKVQADARGTLQMGPNLPAAFKCIDVEIVVTAGQQTQAGQLDQLLRKAEHCCAVLQTLRSPSPIRVTRARPHRSGA